MSRIRDLKTPKQTTQNATTHKTQPTHTHPHKSHEQNYKKHQKNARHTNKKPPKPNKWQGN